MQKPQSMKFFDWLYLGSLAIGLIGLALGWDAMMEQMNAEFAAQGLEPDSSFATSAIVGGFIFGVGISVALWFLVSIMRIEFVKWIVALFTAYGVVSLAGGIAMAGFDMIQLSGIVSTLMSIVAVVMLFRADSKAWFDAKRGDKPEVERDSGVNLK